MRDLNPMGRLDCAGRIGSTPLRTTLVLIADLWRVVHFKLESYNPGGSSKDRTARALLADLSARGLLKKSSIVVESTSGNLGVSLAYLCRELGHRFVAVIDPKTTQEIRARLLNLGAELELVGHQDENGGYLLSRLERVQQLCERSSNYVWTDQYSNLANPHAHFSSTGPEIFTQTGGKADAIFVAVSTGGTLEGIGRYFRQILPKTKVIAVDACGSVVFGGTPAPRKLTGIGSSRRSSFIPLNHNYTHKWVGDNDAFGACRWLERELKLRVGGSSGAVVHACIQTLAEEPELRKVVCLCADGGDNYESTIFCDQWMASHHFDIDYRAAVVQSLVDDRPSPRNSAVVPETDASLSADHPPDAANGCILSN